MAPTPRWGITLPLQGHSLPAQREIIAELPDLGYTDAWSSELSGHRRVHAADPGVAVD